MGLGISYLRREGSWPAHLGFPSENDGDPLDPNEFGHLLIGMAGGDAQRWMPHEMHTRLVIGLSARTSQLWWNLEIFLSLDIGPGNRTQNSVITAVLIPVTPRRLYQVRIQSPCRNWYEYRSYHGILGSIPGANIQRWKYLQISSGSWFFKIVWKWRLPHTVRRACLKGNIISNPVVTDIKVFITTMIGILRRNSRQNWLSLTRTASERWEIDLVKEIRRDVKSGDSLSNLIIEIHQIKFRCTHFSSSFWRGLRQYHGLM